MLSVATSDTQLGRFAEAGSLYNAALLAPQAVKNGPQDIWGNVKIPRYESLDISTQDSQGWLSAPNNATPESFASLVGLPIAGLSSEGSSDFTAEYTYLYVTCKPFIQQAYPGTHGTGDPSATNYTKLDLMLPGQIWYNKSLSFLQPFDQLSGRASFMLDTTRDLARPAFNKGQPDADTYVGRLDGFIGHQNQSRLNDTEAQKPRDIVFASVYGISRDGNDQGLNIATCSVFQQHVEASVSCVGSKCSVTRLRKSRSDLRPNALTPFEYFVILDNFAREFPTAIKFNEGSSPTELFLASTSTFPFRQKITHLYPDEIYTDLSKVPIDLFSHRLSLVLNTYHQLSTQPSGYFGGLTSNLSAYGPDTLPVTDINAYLPSNLSATEHSFFTWFTKFQQSAMDLRSPFLAATTTADRTTRSEIFTCNFAWLALLLTASVVILVTGSIAIVLKRKTLGPELFGFVTSMTYENPWVKIPDGGTMLDAMERGRLLKDVEVHVADVCGDADVGHIAFAAGVPLRKLERGRLYS